MTMSYFDVDRYSLWEGRGGNGVALLYSSIQQPSGLHIWPSNLSLSRESFVRQIISVRTASGMQGNKILPTRFFHGGSWVLLVPTVSTKWHWRLWDLSWSTSWGCYLWWVLCLANRSSPSSMLVCLLKQLYCVIGIHYDCPLIKC